MGIIYVISIIFLLTIFILIKKSNEKLNILGMLGLGIVLILSYNVLECYILNFVRIKLTLLNLSIVNFILIILGAIYIIKRKEIQKYYIKLQDVIFIFLLVIIIAVISHFQYGSNLHIKYESGDASVHYRAVQNFVEADNLLNLENDTLFGLELWKIGSYVNSGLMIKVFSHAIDEFDYYKIFIVFSLFVLFMTGYMIYMTISKFANGKIPVIVFIVSILCLLGYPLNSLIYGFEYMSIGILVVTTLLYVVQFYTNKEIRLKHLLVILFLLNFMLFHSYYQFIPYTYSALFIYICFINYKEDKKLLTKKNIITLLVTLIIPFILGFVYYFVQSAYSLRFLEALINYIFNISGVTSKELFDSLNKITKDSISTQNGIISSFSVFGYTYNSLYGNIILLLPLLIYVIVKEMKNKKTIDFSSMLAIFTIGYIILLIILNYIGKVSDYYVTKNYFALWIILWYTAFKGLLYLYEKKKLVPYLLTGIYLIMMIISYFNFDVGEVQNKLKKDKLESFTEIYNVNFAFFQYRLATYYDKELELMKYAKDNLDKDKKIELLGNETQILWAYPLLDYFYPYREMYNHWFQGRLTFKYNNNEIIDNADYIICFYRSDFYREYDKSKLENLEVIHENAFGKILLQNNEINNETDL